MLNLKAISPESICEAVTLLKQGGVVVLPTDTNYNVFTLPCSETGVKRIFAMKNRESLSPLTLCMGHAMELQDYAYLTPETQYLAKMIWPEKISFILYQKSTVPYYMTRGFGTVAAACPQLPILRQIICQVGSPLAGTSANLSGTGNVPDVRKAIEHIGPMVDLILDGGVSPIDNANTIIDFTFNPPILARAGAYSLDTLRELIPNLQYQLSAAEYKTLAKAKARVFVV